MNLHKKLFPNCDKEKNELFLRGEGFKKDLVEELNNKTDLEKLYNENKEFFQEMLVKEFVGYVPKEVDEPVLKFFADHAPMIQKWLLWQSWYINRKAMHDPLKLMRYDGMMVVYTVLHKMASVSTNIIPSEKPPEKQKEPEVPLIEKELDALQNFKSGFKEKKE